VNLHPGSFIVGLGVGALTLWMLDKVGSRELGTDFVSPEPLPGPDDGFGNDVIDVTPYEPYQDKPMQGHSSRRMRNPMGFQLPPLIEDQMRRLVQAGVRICVDKFGDGVQYLIDEATGRTPIVAANRNGIMVNQPAIEARIRLIPEITMGRSR